MTKHTGTVLRVGVSCVLLCVLVWFCRPNAVWQAMRTAAPLVLAAAFAVYVASMPLVAWRWHVVLQAEDTEVSIWQLTRYYLIGFFFNNFLPSSIGGDVARVFYLSRHAGSMTASFSAIFVERLLGFLAMAALAIMSLLLLMLRGQAPHAVLLGSVTVALALGFVALTLVCFHSRLNAATVRMLAHITLRNIGATIAGVLETIHRYRAHRRALVAALCISLIYQIILGMFTYMVTCGTGLPAPFWLIFALMQLSSLAGIIPITLETAGMREGIYVLALEPLGYASDRVLAALLLVRFLSMLGSALGGIALMYERRHAGTAGDVRDIAGVAERTR